MTEKEMTLKEYVEGRFDRLVIAIDDKLKRQQEEFLEIIQANDLRYQQRFDAQGKALDAAFGAAKGAVDAALAASDKAAVKTEQTADKRFADLGDLIREQFKGLSEKFDISSRRIEVTEGRLDKLSGKSEGSISMWGYVAWAIVMLIALAGVVLTVVHVMKP
jgi:hypothetical protein